jgi:hypothetical protein
MLIQVEITNTMHKFAPLLYSYMLAPTCFDSSLPFSGSFWIRLSYVKIPIDMVVYRIRAQHFLLVIYQQHVEIPLATFPP